MEDQREPGSTKKWSFDKTLNIPTVITILGAVVAIVSFSVDKWNTQERKIDSITATQDRRIDAIERLATSALESSRRLETIQSLQERSQVDQISTLRNEFRSDLRDISNKLDTLLLGRAGIRPETKDWSK